MKFYAYCLTEGIDELPESLNGINGASVQLIKVENFSVLVSDFPGDVVPVNRDNALAHAAAVRSILDRTTPLPFRFGTLVTQQRLESYVTNRRDALQAKLELVRGCVEMSVKIICNQEWTEEPPAKADRDETPGTAFLVEMRRKILGSEARAAEAKKVAAWLEERLSDSIRETRINTNTTDKLLVTAAHLVEWKTVERYRGKLKEARLERPELHFLASGPWPPYSFANIDLEFKTQFGVS